MKSRTLTCAAIVTLFAAMAIPTRLTAQDHQDHNHRKHHHYKFIDIGTLGGPNSYFSAAGDGAQVLNNRGIVAGYGDTSASDPYAPNCFDVDCFLAHAFRWQNGAATDLGALPSLNNSAVSAINERGWIAGFSQNGLIDPLTNGLESDAVIWRNSQIINLGTLGGNESLAVGINDRGQVIGIATNAIPDIFPFPFALGFLGAQQRAFLWEKGVMRDLGTLGGPDSAPGARMNDRGQVTGSSYINFAPNPATGIPTADPFLWEDGNMIDLGSFGGTSGYGLAVNNRGQVIGQSNLAGDVTAHAFLWEQGALHDLGALGGTFSIPIWLNDTGDIVGGATTTGDQLFHAFLWRNGVMKDLGTVGNDGCSEALAVNSEGRTVGQSFSCDFSTARAFLWENGSMIDLNTLIPPNSSLQLVFAGNINDRGVIVGAGVPPGDPPNTDLFGRLFVLIPCDEKNTDGQGCEDEGEGTTVTSQNNPAPVTQASTNVNQGSLTPERLAALRARFAPWRYLPRLGAPRN